MLLLLLRFPLPQISSCADGGGSYVYERGADESMAERVCTRSALTRLCETLLARAAFARQPRSLLHNSLRLHTRRATTLRAHSASRTTSLCLALTFLSTFRDWFRSRSSWEGEFTFGALLLAGASFEEFTLEQVQYSRDIDS